jgi:Bacteriophage HK97-gp10, putative tail-component
MAETIQGYAALIKRLNAVGGTAATNRLMSKVAMAAIAEEKRLVPRKTGNLGRTIHVGAVSSASVQLVASANYAAYVEYGTGPHEITPNAAKALRWTTGATRLSGNPTKGAQRAGQWAFAKRVHHPGTKAHPFMLEGAKAAIAKSPLANLVIAAWNEAA